MNRTLFEKITSAMARLGSFCLAVWLLVLLIPFWIIVLPLVYAEDRRAPILRQVRIGKNKVPFDCFKIRTMKADTAAVASHLASTQQITATGKVLRKTGLDELPQIFNVLLGNMSFIGPRPCLPSQTDLIAAREARGVYMVLPGITGLAQIQGVDMSDPERLARLDGDYVRRKSFALDCKIALATLRGKGAGDAVGPAS